MTNLEKTIVATVITATLGGIGLAVGAIVQAKRDINLLENIKERCNNIKNMTDKIIENDVNIKEVEESE